MKNINSTAILLYRSRLVNYYLAKVFIIIKQKSKHLSIVPNEVKQIIHAINKQKTDYVMACYTEFFSVANTLKKFHIHSNLDNGYKHSFYNYKQVKFDGIFDQY